MPNPACRATAPHVLPRPRVHLHTAVLRGVDATLVGVDVTTTPGDAPFTISGPPPATVRDVSARVRAALAALGHTAPTTGVAVTLLPAGQYRDVPGLDVPVALALLVARGGLKPTALAHTLAVGELGLSGQLLPIRGTVSIAEAARRAGYTSLMVPAANAAEATLVPCLTVLPATSLETVVGHLQGHTPLSAHIASRAPAMGGGLDMADVPGQEGAKVALELAAAGGHPLALVGPLGSGRAMLARRLPTLLPPLTEDEGLEVARLYSASGLPTSGAPAAVARPFRAPHHTISDAGLLGGGPLARPGEASLAHHGVLFLDEAHELRPATLDALHHWLERGEVHLARRDADVLYPCRPLLVATIDACPCGNGHGDARCRCNPEGLARHHASVDRLLRRFDVLAPTHLAHHEASAAEPRPSAWYRARVERARAAQARRFHALPKVDCNARMPASLAPILCPLTPPARKVLDAALAALPVPGDAPRQVLAVARTWADLEGHDTIDVTDMEVALAYFPRLARARLLP